MPHLISAHALKDGINDGSQMQGGENDGDWSFEGNCSAVAAQPTVLTVQP